MAKLFDSHLHIIDERYPLVPNQGYLPEPFTATDYLEAVSGYELCRRGVVSGSFQAYDQNYLTDALSRLGPDFVGVTQLPVTVSDDEILRLDRAGVRAVRFNLKRGGSEDISKLQSMAARVHELAGWHVELYVDAGRLGELVKVLTKLPAVSIDHLGLSREGLPVLYTLAEKGCRVKATGFGRLDFDPQTAIKEIYQINPAALMFGTDLPSTRAPRPFEHRDYDLVIDCLGEAAAERVFCDNAVQFYRPGNPASE